MEAKLKQKNQRKTQWHWIGWVEIKKLSVGWTDAPLLTRVGSVLQPTSSKWTVEWTDDYGIGSSDALGFGYSMDQGSELQHRTIRRLDHRFIWRYHLNSTETRQDFCFSTGWTDAWMEGTIGSSDGLIQIQQNRPKCGAFSTGWSDGASVYSVGVLSRFQGSTSILACISDQMIRRSVGGNHRFIR
jgi:hypothetical protein